MSTRLLTERLILRPFIIDDAPRVQELAGDKEVAETTLGIPHPYPIEAAQNWIKTHSVLIQNGSYPFAVVLKGEDSLIGTMTIRVDKVHKKGEVAYWLGKEYWGKGYATEATKEIVRFGFENLQLNRIWGRAMANNPASIKVMEKAGFKKEGTLVQEIFKDDKYQDVEILGLIFSDFKRVIK